MLVIPGTCGCGCGELTSIYRGKPRRFLPGHHARGENNSNFGKTTKEETRKKIADGNKIAVQEGRHPTATRKGWKHTPETKIKMAHL